MGPCPGPAPAWPRPPPGRQRGCSGKGQQGGGLWGSLLLQRAGRPRPAPGCWRQTRGQSCVHPAEGLSPCMPSQHLVVRREHGLKSSPGSDCTTAHLLQDKISSHCESNTYALQNIHKIGSIMRGKEKTSQRSQAGHHEPLVLRPPAVGVSKSRVTAVCLFTTLRSCLQPPAVHVRFHQYTRAVGTRIHVVHLGV